MKYRREGVTQIRPFLHPIADLSPTSLVYWKGEHSRQEDYKCRVSPWASLVAQMIKDSASVLEARIQFLGWEDALEEEMATHSSILAWRIPWREEPHRL